MVLNMMDIAERMCVKIDTGKLSNEIGVAVVPVGEARNIGTKEVLDTIVAAAKAKIASAVAYAEALPL